MSTLDFRRVSSAVDRSFKQGRKWRWTIRTPSIDLNDVNPSFEIRTKPKRTPANDATEQLLLLEEVVSPSDAGITYLTQTGAELGKAYLYVPDEVTIDIKTGFLYYNYVLETKSDLQSRTYLEGVFEVTNWVAVYDE